MHNKNDDQARSFSEALLTHGAIAGLTDEKDLSSEAIQSLLSSLGLDGKDPLEVALVVQMLTCHCQIIKNMGKSSKSTHPMMSEQNTNLALKLMNLYAKQTEVLMKYRSKNNKKES